MRLEPTLTKENFWNGMNEKYPLAMRVFCDWIDKYKKAVEWDNLFNDSLFICYLAWEPFPQVKLSKSPKFHEIPGAMQLGIWIEFVRDQGGCSWEIDDMFSFDLSEEIEHYFRLQQFTLDRDAADKTTKEA